MRGTIVILVCSALLALPSTAYGDLLGAAGAGLAKDPLYVDRRVSRDAFGGPDATQVRSVMRGAGAGRVYVAVLAAFRPGDESAVTAEEMARGVAAFVREDGTYAVFVGDEFAAVSTESERGAAGRLAARSLAEHGDEGIAATLTDFLVDLGPLVRERSFAAGGDFGPAPSDENDDRSSLPLIAGILAAAGLAGGGYLVGRR